jgi:membrane associated rhomboid family serine protease
MLNLLRNETPFLNQISHDLSHPLVVTYFFSFTCVLSLRLIPTSGVYCLLGGPGVVLGLSGEGVAPFSAVLVLSDNPAILDFSFCGMVFSVFVLFSIC